MPTTLHRTNTNFQLTHFIAGACHTADAAYFTLYNQREDRLIALRSAEVDTLRTQARRLKIQAQLQSDDPIIRLEAEADLKELEHGTAMQETLIAAAQEELRFIEECMAKLQPLRKYAHLPDAEAAEAYQAEEWAHEMRFRAENFLVTQGSIPADHFASMRQHPAFSSFILPHIEQIHNSIKSGQVPQVLLAKPRFDLPKLMGLDTQLCLE